MTEPTPRTLEHVRKVFDELGRRDPMYAALTRSRCEDNRWDAAEFFDSGRQEISETLAYVDALGVTFGRARALDFGSAVGRLTQALAEHFENVVGVDIAQSMIDAARHFNRFGARVAYLLNTRPDLQLLETASFDFVYSNKVLQHIPPDAQASYIQELVRVLRPGGVTVFQLRNGPHIRPGSLRALHYRLYRTWFRRFARWIRRRPAYEMHFIARARVEELIREAGGEVIDVVDLSRTIPNLSLRFCVRRLPA